MEPIIGEPSQLSSEESSGTQKQRRSKIAIVLSIFLAVGLLYFSLRRVSWAEMLQTLRQLQPEYVGLGFLFNTIALYARGQRWGVLISARKHPKPLDLFFTSAIGYLGNSVLPARAGEILRSAVLGKTMGISGSFVFATALTERLMDFIALLLIGSICILAGVIAIPQELFTIIPLISLISILALVIFFSAWRLEHLFQKIIDWMRIPEHWRSWIIGFLNQFLLGTRALVDLRRACFFLAFTAMIWLFDGVGTVVFAHGFDLSVSLDQALLLLVAMGLSSALPSTPGYVGIYQFVAVTVMPAFGITPSQALVFILSAQAVNVSTIVLWGLLGLWRFGGWNPLDLRRSNR